MEQKDRESWKEDLRGDIQGCSVVAAILMVLLVALFCLFALFIIQVQVQVQVPREGNKKIPSPLFFVIIKLLGQTKKKTFGQVCPRKLAYTRLQLVKTAKLPLDAFQLDHWPKHLAFQTSFTQKLQFIWLTRVAYASWLAQARLNDKTPTSIKLTILTQTKLDQNQFGLTIFRLAKTVYLGQTGLVYSALHRTINSVNRT